MRHGGVGNELYQAGGVSWPTLVVALGYPLYFILRRRFGTDNLGGLWCELALMLPAAAWFAFGDGGAAALQINAELYWRIPLLASSAPWRWCVTSSPAACCRSACSAC